METFHGGDFTLAQHSQQSGCVRVIKPPGLARYSLPDPVFAFWVDIFPTDMNLCVLVSLLDAFWELFFQRMMDSHCVCNQCKIVLRRPLL